jgi:hypothetical protein
MWFVVVIYKLADATPECNTGDVASIALSHINESPIPGVESLTHFDDRNVTRQLTAQIIFADHLRIFGFFFYWP